ncbi:response regulator [Achromobacter ruhlandii]|uniref:response regulator n=1 Tax=Achromobacter ruhlandii TaxID=72557 RepID=UPI001E4B4AF8|nr:response regulator [Achromobacter ruhlandii]
MTKILLVDDQPTLVALMSEFLSGEGYEVATHTDGLTALRQMLELRPDVVITDFSMPGMDGGALLTAMRENAYLSDTPVLVLSGRPESELEAACSARATLLRKPAEPQDVLHAIRSLHPAPALAA